VRSLREYEGRQPLNLGPEPYRMLTKESQPGFSKPLTVDSWVSSHQTTLTVPSDLEWMDRILQHLQMRAVELVVCDHKNSTRIRIALHEALTNAVVHGSFEISSTLKEGDGSRFAKALAKKSADHHYASRNIIVQFDYRKTQSRWIITDEGNGFDVDRITKPDDDDEPSFLMSGRGLPMMRAFMDDVQYKLGGRQCILTLKRQIPSVESSNSQPNHTADQSPFDALMAPFLNSLLSQKIEQRSHERVPYTEQITICEPDCESRIAFARNLSKGGIAFISDFKIEADTISMTLPHPDGDMLATGEVLRNSKMTAGIYDVGVRFSTLELVE
jgi:anti-sigma regulatory factor (Ser/Thr protein kinase)